MRYRDQIIGMVALSDPHRVWTAEERELVQSVIDQVGIALENARLVMRIEGFNRELEQKVRERTRELEEKHSQLLQAEMP